MIVKLLTEHHLEFLGLKVGSRGSSESTHVKMSNCWKSHALAHFLFKRFLDSDVKIFLKGLQLGGGGVFDCRLSGMHMLSAIYI